ncbi:MAG: general secretion pathway protein GspB [Burkholderiales bacterium]
MSYILDALRKSDQQRQRGAAPTLLASLATPVVPRPPALLSYGLLALVLVGAGVAIGWLRPWQPQSAAPAVRLAAMPPEPAPSQPAPVPPEPAPKSKPQARIPSAAPAAPRQAATEVSRKALEPVPEQRANTGAAAVAPAQTAMSMAELPVAIQQELPAMSITVHAYSAKPADRLVGINNRLLREGNEVAPGLKLERITPDGMILNYKGYSFRRGVH